MFARVNRALTGLIHLACSARVISLLVSFLTHGVYGIGANDVWRPWFCYFVMAQRVILGAMGP